MIVITAVTSSIGNKVLRRLLEAQADLRVITRDASQIDSASGGKVDIVEGSHADRGVVARATKGAEAVFWLVPNMPKAASLDEAYSGFTRPGLEAMVEQGVKRIVGISGLGRGTPQARHAGPVTATLANDDRIASSGIAYRAITCPSFFDNLLRQVHSIRDSGTIFTAIDPSRSLPGCATEDIAEAASRFLLDDSWTGIGHQAVLGPEDLSFNDMASQLTELLRRAVRCERVGYAALTQQYLGRGMSQAMAQGLADMMRAKSEGLDNGEVRTASNTTPTSFRRWAEAELKSVLAG